MNPDYKFSIDKSLEQLKDLPDGDSLYRLVKDRAEKLAAAMDLAVMELIEKHELPTRPEEVLKAGFQLCIEVHNKGTPDEHRVAVLYKRVDEVEIKL